MIQSFPQYAVRNPNVGPTNPGNPQRFQSPAGFIRPNNASEDCRRLISGHRYRAPHFLMSRIGLSWTRILSDLRSVARSEAEYSQWQHHLAEFVETKVTGTSEEPRHGTGLLIGQPLTAGWRRRLYVCPESERLFPITELSLLKDRH